MLRLNGEIINRNCSEKSSRSYPCVPPSCAKRSNQQSRTSFFLASQYSFSFLAAPDLPLSRRVTQTFSDIGKSIKCNKWKCARYWKQDFGKYDEFIKK
jgi:hypothetical protein